MSNSNVPRITTSNKTMFILAEVCVRAEFLYAEKKISCCSKNLCGV